MDSSPTAPMPTTVLVIDDDDVIRMVVREALAASGFTVLEAAEPTAGIKIARTAMPDLILLDIMLPHIDGLAVLEHLRAQNCSSKVIVFSATGTRHAEQAFALGARGFMSKPFEITELVEALTQLAAAA
jgi:CheY-like chemotaxis protein